jgi:hypothetical protein
MPDLGERRSGVSGDFRSGSYELLERTAGVVYAACGNIWTMTIFAEPKLADMKAARPALAAMSRRSPGGFPTLTWILPQAGFRMDNDARDIAGEITRSFESSIVAQATLIEGSGFQAAAVRAIVNGLDLVSRSRCKKKVFSDLGEAVVWCLVEGGASSSRIAADDVRAGLIALRSSLPADPE